MGNFSGIKGRKDNSRTKGVLAKEKAQRHLEAQLRQAAYDSLTLSQKMKLTASRQGNSQREKNKLALKAKK